MTVAAPLLLAAHGSRDPRSGAAIRRLSAAVAARWPGAVVPAFLERDEPDVASALRFLADGRRSDGGPPPVVVPALLTAAYHGRVDLPGVLARSGVEVTLAPVLGPEGPGAAPDPLLLAALRRGLSDLDREGEERPCEPGAPSFCDGIVLLAAGTRDVAARSTVEAVASALGVALSLPCVAGYATADPRSGAQAVRAVRARGATRVVAASYFLAPGQLHDLAANSAREAGVTAVTAPLADAPELADLVLARADALVLADLGSYEGP